MKASVIVLFISSLVGLNVGVYRVHVLVNVTMSFQEAQQHCTQNFDYLSTVRSKDLKNLSSNAFIIGDSFWIGVQRDSADYSKWIWSEGGEATITFWAKDEPDNDPCGGVNKNTLALYARHCYWSLSFYCMLVYELILVHQQSTWEEALEYCRRNYIDLAIINSEDVMEEAKINSTVADTDEVWTGLRFLDGHWFWVNGAGLYYDVWSSDGEIKCPDKNQRCGVFDRTQGVCKPTDCERRLNFLCVKRKYKN